MSTYGGVVIQPATDAEREAIRAAHDSVIVASKSHTGARLHIPDGDEPLCATEGKAPNPVGGWKPKPMACYPPQYRPLCKHCVNEWRGGR